MKETGIIMSGNHPKLILDGTKTMTRRVIKLPNAPNHLGDWEATYLGGDGTTRDSRGVLAPRIDGIWHTRTGKFIKCPYGQVGDRLWLRETWRLVGRSEDRSGCCRLTVEYKCDAVRKTFEVPRTIFNKYTHNTGWGVDSKWRPSIFMPRWASRILLEITEVRVERLQKITEKDMQAEGVIQPTDISGAVKVLKGLLFVGLWDSLNAKRGYGWDTNPWVWVISFRKLKED